MIFDKKQLTKDIYIIVFLISVIGFGLGAYIYGVSYHSIDMGYNVRFLNAEYDLNLVDYTANGGTLTDLEMYNLGWKQNKQGVFLLIVSSLYLGVCLLMLSLSINKKTKK